jgi:NDP-sugar pyrophosphorylase family protein
MDSPVKVFLLAGGLGTRIRSLFPDCPKPMIPFGGKPFLQWQIELLMTQGFDEFVLCVGYLFEQVKEYFGDGSRLGAKIHYSVEQAPLGTGGALRNAASYFHQTIILLNGDTYLI